MQLYNISTYLFMFQSLLFPIFTHSGITYLKEERAFHLPTK